MAGNRFVGDSKLELESIVVFGNSKRTLDHSGFFFKNFFFKRVRGTANFGLRRESLSHLSAGRFKCLVSMKRKSGMIQRFQ